MTTKRPDLARLVPLLRSIESSLAQDPGAALARLGEALGSLPPHLQTAIQALKKPGAWRDKPLPPNTPSSPYYIATPCAIDIENVPAATLQAELARQSQQQPPPADAQGNAQVTLLPLLQN